MNRPTTELIQQIGRGATRQQHPQTRFRGILKVIHYESRRVQVAVKGFGTIHAVCAKGLPLGTTQVHLANVGDGAVVVKHEDTQRWECIALSNKNRCATPAGTPPDVELQTADARTASGFSQLITPSFIFTPPVLRLGQLTPQAQRAPDDLLICGIPSCTNCAPDGYEPGMALILSSDDDHETCWVWGFRGGGCVGGGITPIGTAAGIASRSVTLFGGGTTWFGALPAGFCSDGVTVFGSTRLVSNGSATAGSFVSAFDMTPALISTLVIDAVPATFVSDTGYIDQIFLVGTNLYARYIGAVVAPGVFFKVIDVSNPASMSVTATYTLSSPLTLSTIVGVYDSGAGVFAIWTDASSFYFSNVSAPNTIVGSFTDSTLALTLAGTVLVTASSDENSWYLYDVSDPTAPSLAYSFTDVAKFFTGAAIHGTTLYLDYVTDDGMGGDEWHLISYDISTLTAPALLADKVAANALDALPFFAGVTAQSDYRYFSELGPTYSAHVHGFDRFTLEGLCLGNNPLTATADETLYVTPYYPSELGFGVAGDVIYGWGVETNGTDNKDTVVNVVRTRLFLYQGQ